MPKGKRVTIRRRKAHDFEISYGGVKVGSAHDAHDGPVWYVRSDIHPVIPLRNSAAEGLRYDTAEQAARDAAAYARAALRRGRA